MKSYHNTNQESGATLQRSETKAQSQEKKVYLYLRSHPGGLFTAERIWEVLFSVNTPLTSIRRALSNLSAEGKIERTNFKKLGKYGKSIFLYRFNDSTLF